jgi:hypothetical protein
LHDLELIIRNLRYLVLNVLFHTSTVMLPLEDSPAPPGPIDAGPNSDCVGAEIQKAAYARFSLETLNRIGRGKPPRRLAHFPGQSWTAILRHPNQMNLAVPDRMTARSVILHAPGLHPGRLKARNLPIPENEL